MFSVTEKLRFIQSVFGAGHLASNGKNFDVRCPMCAPSSAEKRKLIIRMDDDVTHCWTCGWGSRTLAPLIKKYGSVVQMQQYRDVFMPRNYKFVDQHDEVVLHVELPHDFRLLVHAPMTDPDVMSAWSYLRKRGVTVKDAWYYKLGISNEYRWSRRIIMPLFDADGSLNFFVARNVDENDRRPRYDNPPNDKLSIVFNEYCVDWTQRLVICEGPFDLMKCGENSVPLLGSDLNENSLLFNKILLNETPVAIALDGDMWATKTPRIVKKLQEYDVNVVVVDVRKWDDPGKMTKGQFQMALKAARTPTWSETFLDKLARVSKVQLRLTV